MSRILLIVIFTATLLAASPGYLAYRHAFGFKTSSISGHGAFYTFKPSPKIGLQLSGIYYFYDGKIRERERTVKGYTSGFSIQRDIVQEQDYRFYLTAGAFYYFDDNKTQSARLRHVIKNSYNSGFGIGYEYFFHRVTLGLEVGYKYYKDKAVEKIDQGDWHPVLERVTKLGAGLNLGFIF